MKAYLVGGAVRDKLLGMTIEDRDWVVVGATEQEMLDAGYRKLDASFPVFAHPETGEEYALARTEVKTGPGYKGFQVYAGPDVTLEQDLKRRDLTINAMAEDETGQIIDPFNGREDLEQGLLRHVSPAFDEDPVRLLRLARFAARLGRWGFRVAHGTFGMLKKMAVSEELRTLKPERVWMEITRALGDDQPWRFFDVLHRCGALDVLIPELDLGDTSSHSGSVKPEPLAALIRICKTTADPATRFAVLMHQAAVDCADPTGMCRRLRAGKDFCEPMQLLRDHGGRLCKAMDLNAEVLLDLLDDLHAMQRPDRFEQLVRAAKALCPDQTPIGVRLRTARNAAARIGGDELRAEGLAGEALGEALRQRRIAAISSDLRGR